MHSSEVSCRIEGELWCIHGLKTKRPRKTVLKCKEICSPSFIILISIQRFKKLPQRTVGEQNLVRFVVLQQRKAQPKFQGELTEVNLTWNPDGTFACLL